MLAFIGVLLVLATSAFSCNKSEAEAAAEWIAKWSGTAKRTPLEDLRLPAAQTLALAGVAARSQTDVRNAGHTLADLRASAHRESTKVAADYTKETLCAWFGWYVEDKSHVVKDVDSFVDALISVGFKVSIKTPPFP